MQKSMRNSTEVMVLELVMRRGRILGFFTATNMKIGMQFSRKGKVA